MEVTIEISHYPLSNNYCSQIDNFIENMKGKNIKLEVGKMSSLISGEYDSIMHNLTLAMKEVMLDIPSVFNIKISNSC